MQKRNLVIALIAIIILILIAIVILGIDSKKKEIDVASYTASSSETGREISNMTEEPSNTITDEPIVIILSKKDKEEKKKEEKQENKEENEEKNATKKQEEIKTESINKTTSVSNKKYYIKVNYKQNVVTIYTKDSNGNYTVPVKAMICSTGTATPTSGVYDIKLKWKWLGLFGDVYGYYTTQIVGNILFHSVPYLEKGNPGSLEYWEYDKLGTSCSMGCIRLTVADAKWIYNNIESGTLVEFYSSSNPGPLGKPTAQKISDNKECRDWDPTDTDSNNPWHTYNKKKQEESKKNEEATKEENKKTDTNKEESNNNQNTQKEETNNNNNISDNNITEENKTEQEGNQNTEYSVNNNDNNVDENSTNSI